MRAYKPFQTFVVLAFLIGHAGAARAQSTFPLTVVDRTATAVIELPGGYAADLSLKFENVLGLTAGALEVSARVLSQLDVLAVQARLPAGAASSIPAAFPVLLQIEPTSSSALSLAGIVTISIHTHNLTLDVASPLGLYSASAGGAFRDITQFVGIGSYRVDGSTGGFSEFVIAADSRPLGTTIGQKFDALQNTLTEYEASIPLNVRTLLQGQLSLARSLYSIGLLTAAVAVLQGFGYVVQVHSGDDIPNVWIAHGAATNIAGLLRSQAHTLRFSVILAANQQR
jgi:hypothetical protein